MSKVMDRMARKTSTGLEVSLDSRSFFVNLSTCKRGQHDNVHTSIYGLTFSRMNGSSLRMARREKSGLITSRRAFAKAGSTLPKDDMGCENPRYRA